MKKSLCFLTQFFLNLNILYLLARTIAFKHLIINPKQSTAAWQGIQLFYFSTDDDEFLLNICISVIKFIL